MVGTYSKKVMTHFRNPHNCRKMKNFSGCGKLGNPICGDILWIYIKVGKNKEGKEIIKDASFQTFGCVAAIATSSMITDLAKGKTLEQAARITNRNIAKALGNLPPIKMHCSDLASDALKAAIEDYRKRHPK